MARPKPATDDLDGVRARIRRAADILQIVGEHTELKRHGREWWGCCPLHGEDTPSLHVDAESGFWYCHGFGCARGGDVISFVMDSERLAYPDAVELLCKRYGVENRPPTKEEKAEQIIRAQVRDLFTALQQVFQNEYAGSAGESYLLSRGFETAVVLANGGGYCPSTKLVRKVSKEFPSRVVEASGIFLSRQENGECDLWHQRVTFPIVWRGNISNFYARFAGPCDKALSHRYITGREKIGWNLDLLRRGDAVVAEGVLDALALIQAQVEPAVAFLGTQSEGGVAGFLSRVSKGRKVTLAFDADDENDHGQRPGQEGALKVASALMAEGIHTDMIDLTAGGSIVEGTDPAAMLASLGAAKLHEVCRAPLAPLAFAHLWNLSAERSLVEADGSEYLLRFGEGREYRVVHLDNVSDARGIQATLELREVGRLLAKDKCSLFSDISRRRFCKSAAARETDSKVRSAKEQTLGDELLELDGELKKLVSERLDHTAEEEEDPEATMSEEDRAEALEFLKEPRLLETIVNDLDRLGVVGEGVAGAASYLIMTSRLMHDPLFGVIKGTSSAGKSYVAGTVALLCPPEDLRDFSRITPKALFYVPLDWAKHKFLLIRERAGGEDADYSLRTLISEKGLSIALPEKNEAGVLETSERFVEGPVSYLETTTMIDIDPEVMTRLLEIYVDESQQQTQRVQERQRDLSSVDALRFGQEREVILRRHHNAQRLLRTLPVVIPYAHHLTFPSDSVRNRRDNDKFLRLVRVIAFLHQHHKEVKVLSDADGDVEYIEADLRDYRLAWELAGPLFSPTLDDLDKRARELLLLIYGEVRRRYARDNGLVIEDQPDDRIFQIRMPMRDIRALSKMSVAQTRAIVTNLVDEDLLRVDGGRQGRTFYYSIGIIDPQQPVLTEVLHPDALASLLEEERT